MIAHVHAFPLHRHRGLVQRLAQEVFRAGPNRTTRDAMIETLGIEWERLESYGVQGDEIEQRLHELARELWLRLDRVGSSAVRA
ncbi:hypothetical protein NLM27_08635 [Bradyrhizobium sp. CCGB12]|uniref:hypothetical protein n=1 Tax=Bradyrhizobium sp. CCGB12 TaxID=2949632 RepID=UPI0020B1D89F|nr:hypothetical protein [Bradyrhizobium sp. CCGB12]MCP3388843.1 hypothetical protein [Bradyrhizobium sp. CCGB12]